MYFQQTAKRKKALLCVMLLLLTGYIFCLPRELFDVSCATVVTDRNGELLGARIAADGQWRFPPCDTVAEKLAICLTTFEDRYYRYHWGVNPCALGRALVRNVSAGRVISGGSTITMQTIRLSRQKKRTVGEKLIEIILATRLEFRYSKDRILALYASHAPFGGNVVGVDAAAWRYFGHSPDQLSWAEAATLAVLPNAPATVHPSRNREALRKKRDRLLRQLYQRNVMDAMDYELALSEALPSAPHPLPQSAPHLVSYFHQHRPGKQTVTSLDHGVQTHVESLLERWHATFVQSDIRNLAAIVVDVRTNRVLAYCGNVNFMSQHSGNQVDVIRAPRSTGSILKPLLYYAALQDGDILPHMLLPDIPMDIRGFSPQNFNRQFDGAVPASQVIARSLNVPSVSLLSRYGAPKFYGFLKNAGLSTLTRPSSHYGLSLILGGAEATLWDMTSVYADMARTLNGAARTTCSFLLREETPGNRPEIFRPGAVWQTFDAIKEVNRPEDIDWHTLPSMQTIAWKTGTSFGFRDAWAVGVTPAYAVGIWVGNASGEGKPGLTGARTAGPVMFDVFNILPASAWFEPPAGAFTEVDVCRLSGHLKGRFCDDTETLLICPNGQKTTACPYHKPVTLTVDERFRVYEHCAGDRETVRQNRFVLPPAWEWFYRQHHPEYKPLPPFRADCGDDAQLPMQFIYPHGHAHVSLPKQLDGSRGQITFELAHSSGNATVYWHLDEDYVTATRDFHKLSLSPSAGEHSVTVVDDEGHTLSIRIVVD
ncbi:MAG: penicillin-binding protein 1C [Tannerella sp.]|jgi:penicillin-binding protein 1C|nr:penicillin-binding protein 1C [Tannerella sp.]